MAWLAVADVERVDLRRAMRELDTCVTGGTQTHASDGMAMLRAAPVVTFSAVRGADSGNATRFSPSRKRRRIIFAVMAEMPIAVRSPPPSAPGLISTGFWPSGAGGKRSRRAPTYRRLSKTSEFWIVPASPTSAPDTRGTDPPPKRTTARTPGSPCCPAPV